jgi:hypothetical protein
VAVQVDDRFVLDMVEECQKQGTFEFAVCVNRMGQERRVVRFIKLSKAMEKPILNTVAQASDSDDLATTERPGYQAKTALRLQILIAIY